MKEKYAWKFDNLYKANATKVKLELDTLGEKFTPADVVEYARSEDSELHKCFEWDDTIAAEKYRLTQAAQVIRAIVYVDQEKEERTPIRVVISTGNNDNTYTPSRLIFRDKTEYQRLLERALAELRAFKEKYKNLKELDYILELID